MRPLKKGKTLLRLLNLFSLKPAVISIALLFGSAFGALADEATDTDNKFSRGNQSGVHADSWVFGQSVDRNAPIWSKGKTGKSFEPKNKKPKNKEIVDGERKSGIRSSLGLDVTDESAAWKVTPSQKNTRADELKLRENRHILGAYADVEAGDDLNIRVGPELILKDESHGEESAYSNQPDSSLGLGMKFKYDF